LAIRLIRSFMESYPSEEPRHLRRVGKTRQIEKDQLKGN